MSLHAQDLRERVFNALPAASYQMDQLLGLLDVVADRSVPSAAVECTERPRLLINPDFVEQNCRHDEDLLVLVMHELYHVMLGHTRLFPRATRSQNIAFDAVINAMIARQLPGPECAEFLRAVNPPDRFPACLLRPPDGWPHASHYPVEMSERVRGHLELLYGASGDQITYQELFEDLAQDLEGDPGSDAVLLGDHSGLAGEGRHDPEACDDPLLGDILRRVASRWPTSSGRTMAPGTGGQPWEVRLEPARQARADFAAALIRLLRRAGVGARERRGRRGLVLSDVESIRYGVLRNAGDRRAVAFERLWGQPPLLWQTRVTEPRPRPRPGGVAHVYLDVSGSMSSVLPMVAAALDGPHRRGECRTFVFSTVVDEVPSGGLEAACLANTGGTSIQCVLQHLMAIPRASRPRRVVLLTDGLVGYPRSDVVDGLLEGGLGFFVGLVNSEHSLQLAPIARHIEELPRVPG